MKIVLDPQAGICGGVRRAIQLVEEELHNTSHDDVYVLGDIIHNEREVERLEEEGLKTLYKSDLSEISSRDNNPVVLVRAHGEPPDTFQKLGNIGTNIIDGTCPVVKRNQELAHEYYNNDYQVVVIGKHHHPEVIGILGYTDNNGICVQYEEDTEILNPDQPTIVMAQTTIDSDWFEKMLGLISNRVKNIEVKNTICRFVLRRMKRLHKFTKQCDVVLVVGGHKSSNTKMLHQTCKAINSNSYHVVSTDEINKDWLNGKEIVGVTGSASTPVWLLDEFVETLNGWISAGNIY